MVRAKETVEEQLLRMIEGPGGPASSRPPLRHVSPERLLEQFRSHVDGIRRWVLPQPSGAGDGILWRLHLAERVSWIMLGGLGLYLGASLLLVNHHPPALVIHTARPSVTELHSMTGAAVEDRMKPVAEYQEALVTRNPFGLSAHEAVKDQGVKSRLDQLTGSLSVVGINRGRVPEALIEDATAQRTYVVKVGDQVNGLTVKAIDQQGVVVSYENQEIHLQ